VVSTLPPPPQTHTYTHFVDAKHLCNYINKPVSYMRLVMLGRVISPHIHCTQQLTQRYSNAYSDGWHSKSGNGNLACDPGIREAGSDVPVMWHLMMRWTYLCTSATSPWWQFIVHSSSKCCQNQPYAFSIVYKSSQINRRDFMRMMRHFVNLYSPVPCSTLLNAKDFFENVWWSCNNYC
jgi:hypothetical protein